MQPMAVPSGVADVMTDEAPKADGACQAAEPGAGAETMEVGEEAVADDVEEVVEVAEEAEEAEVAEVEGAAEAEVEGAVEGAVVEGAAVEDSTAVKWTDSVEGPEAPLVENGGVTNAATGAAGAAASSVVGCVASSGDEQLVVEVSDPLDELEMARESDLDGDLDEMEDLEMERVSTPTEKVDPVKLVPAEIGQVGAARFQHTVLPLACAYASACHSHAQGRRRAPSLRTAL